ncbi:hypothetical protein [Paraclostridium dentum]|uniref:hypothetical protein n=1 Tax=Paraclostridium dentum TaxID=2662455 RepID=UPI003F3449BD
MKYNICGLIDLSIFNDFRAINTIDVFDKINLNVFVNNFENTNINNINYKNSFTSLNEPSINYDITDFLQKFNIELINISVNLFDININKKSNINTAFYFIKFIYSLEIHFTINSVFKSINIKNIHSCSFIHNDLEVASLHIYPINFNLYTLENELYYDISSAVIDKSISIDCFNTKESSSDDINLKYIKNKDYSYMDLSEEFI